MCPSTFARRGGLPAAIRGSLPDPSNLFAVLGAAALGLAGGVPAAWATTYVVDTTGDPGPAGTTSLRQAIAQANLSTNDLIQFAPSLNNSTITISSQPLEITAPMAIEGPGADKLTLSGNDKVGILYAHTGGASPLAVTVSGLTLTHGKSVDGGAIYTKNVALTLQNSVISGNSATSGGAIYAFSDGGHASQAAFSNVTIQGNSASFVGGGIYASGGAGFTLSHVVIATNTATQAHGGAFFFNAGSIVIDDSLIDGNTTGGQGGGMQVTGSSLYLSNTSLSGNSTTNGDGGGLVLDGTLHISGGTISGNTAGGAGARGGGLLTGGGYTAITGTRIIGNSADNGGGILLDNAGALLNIAQSTISGNKANAIGAFGGGIDVEHAAFVHVTASLISGNSTYNYSGGGGGGGIALRKVYSSATVRNSTVYGNFAYNNGGGIGIFDATTGNNTYLGGSTIADNHTFAYTSNGILGAGLPTLDGCIVANNSSLASSQDLAGSFSASFSLIRTPGSASLGGTGNITGNDPQLGPLTVNGGPTLTLLPGLTSPVLDAGDPSLSSGTDQRGLPRVVNGRADIGAVERQDPEDIIFRDGFDSS